MFYRKRGQNHLFLVKLVVGEGVGVTLRVWYTLFEFVSDGVGAGMWGNAWPLFLPWLTFHSQPGGFTWTIFIRNSYFSRVTKVMNFLIRRRNNLAHILQEKYKCKNNGTLKKYSNWVPIKWGPVCAYVRPHGFPAVSAYLVPNAVLPWDIEYAN